MGCCNNNRPQHKPPHKPHVPCPDNYVDVSRIDPKEYEDIALLLGMNDCGFIYPVKKPGLLEIFEVDGNGDKALFDDGKYKEVLTKDELGEYIKLSMEDYVKYTSTDDVELRRHIILNNACSLKAINTSGNKFNVAGINASDEMVLGDTAIQTVIQSIGRPTVRTYTNPSLGRAAFNSQLAYLSDVDANAGKIDEIKTDLTAIDGRVTVNEGDITSLKGRVTTNEGDISSLKGRVTTNEGDIAGLKTKTGDNADKITALDGRVTVNEGDIAGLKTKTGENADKITALDGRVTTNEGDITSLKGRVTTNEGDIADLKTKTDDNAANISDLETAVNADLSALDGRVTTNKNDIDGLKTKTQENADKISDLEAEISSGNTDLTALEGRVTTNEGKIAGLETDVTTNKNNIGALDGRMTTAEGKITGLEAQTVDLEDGLALTNDALGVLDDRVTVNEGAINTNVEDIAALRSDMANKEHFRGYYPTISDVLSIPDPKTGDFAYCAQTETKWAYNGSTWTNTDVHVPDQTVEASDDMPKMDKPTGEAGSINKYARTDHVHPSDVNKADKTELNNYLPLSGNSQATGMGGDIWLGTDHKVRLSDAGNSYINLDSDGQKVEIKNTGVGGIELNAPAGIVKANGNEVVTYDAQNDINAKNNVTLKTDTKLQGINAASNKVNLIGADRYGNIEAGNVEDKFIIASKERPVVKEGNLTKSVAYLDELNASGSDLQAQITANRNDIDANIVKIGQHTTEITDLKNQENFRGFYATATEITAILNPKLNDFAYNLKTNTKWMYNGSTWYNTGETVPINSVKPSNETPKENGIANAGDSLEYSRGNHVHPTDTSRASQTEFVAYKTTNDLKVGQIDTKVNQHDIYITDFKDNVKPQVAQNTSDIATLKTKAGNIVQANWTETDFNSYAYINNKPNLDLYATKTDLADLPNANWAETNTGSKSYIENKPELGSMAAEKMEDYATSTRMDAVEATLGNKVSTIIAGANIAVDTTGGVDQPEISVTGVITQIHAGSNVSVVENGSERTIAVTGIELPEKFTSSEIVEGKIGDSKVGLDYSKVEEIIAGSTFGLDDIVIFINGVQAQVTAYNSETAKYDATIVQIPQEVSWGGIGGTLALQEDLQDELDKKVDKIEGKALSTNDFTTPLKTKLEGIKSATEAAEGLMRLATGSEVILAVNDTAAVTPLKLRGMLDKTVTKAIQDGNYRIVNTTTDRDELTATEGLLCYVKSNDLIYYYDGAQWVEWKPGLQLDPDSKNVSVSEEGLLIENNYVIAENEAARNGLTKYEGLHVYTKLTEGGTSTQHHKLSPEYRKIDGGATTNLANLPVDVDGLILGTQYDGLRTSDIQLIVENVGDRQFPSSSGTESTQTRVYLDSYVLETIYEYTDGSNLKCAVIISARESSSGNQTDRWTICEYDPATGLITAKFDTAIAAVNSFIQEHKPSGNIETTSSNSYTDSVWIVTVNWMPLNAVGTHIRPTNISQINGVKFSKEYLKHYMTEVGGYPDPFLQWNGANYIMLYSTDTTLQVRTTFAGDHTVATFASGETNVSNFIWSDINIDELNADIAVFFASNPTGEITLMEPAPANYSFLMNLGAKGTTSTFWNSNSTSEFDIIGENLYVNNWLPMDSLGRKFAIQDAQGNNLVSVESVTETSGDVLDIILYASNNSSACYVTVDRTTNMITNVQGDLMSIINASLAQLGKTFEEAKPIQVVNYPAGFSGETGSMPIPGGGAWEGNIHNIAAQNGGSVSIEWNNMVDNAVLLDVHYTDNTNYMYSFFAKPANGTIELFHHDSVIWTGYTSQTTPTEMGGTFIGQSGDLKTALINSATEEGKTIDWEKMAILENYPQTDSWLVLKVDSGSPDNWLYYGVTTTELPRPKKEYWNGTKWVELPLDIDNKTIYLENGIMKSKDSDLIARVQALETTVGTLNEYLEKILNGNG